jgi:hypothetical protein
MLQQKKGTIVCELPIQCLNKIKSMAHSMRLIKFDKQYIALGPEGKGG